VNFHTKVVGAFDAIILSTLAAVTIVMTVALLNPAFASFEATGKHASVTIVQIA
jgi:hypothetical protein